MPTLAPQVPGVQGFVCVLVPIAFIDTFRVSFESLGPVFEDASCSLTPHTDITVVRVAYESQASFGQFFVQFVQ